MLRPVDASCGICMPRCSMLIWDFQWCTIQRHLPATWGANKMWRLPLSGPLLLPGLPVAQPLACQRKLACAIQWVRLNKVSMVGHCLSNFMLPPGAQLVGRVVAAAAARQCALSTVWQPRGF